MSAAEQQPRSLQQILEDAAQQSETTEATSQATVSITELAPDDPMTALIHDAMSEQQHGDGGGVES